MSIATEITRLQTAKSDLKTSIENKGVTVPASTLISGYSALVDQIITGGTPNIQALNITTNGTYTATGSVDGYSPITVSVSGGGYATETGTWTPATDTTRGTISFNNTHSKPPAFYIVMDSTEDLTIPTSTNLYNSFIDVYQFLGLYMPNTSEVYSVAHFAYKGSSSTSQGTVMCNYAYTNPGANSSSYSRYWATETEINPFGNSGTRYWKSTRTYKWFAMWI